jgi:thymidylate synthase
MKGSNNHIAIQAASLGDAWIECMELILERGEKIADDNELLLEVRNLYVAIESVSEGDLTIRSNADSSRIDLMQRKYTSCDVVANYKISYGKLLYDYDGVNQLEWLIERLQRKRETKAATIALHPPGREDLSCLSLIDCKLREDVVEMTAVYRSQNIFGSQPGNVIALDGVHRRVAEELGVGKGVFNLVVLSAHIYERDVLAARDVLRNVSGTDGQSDKVGISKEGIEAGVRGLGQYRDMPYE